MAPTTTNYRALQTESIAGRVALQCVLNEADLRALRRELVADERPNVAPVKSTVMECLMVLDALPEACRWFAEIPGRGNAWSATRHALAIFLSGIDLASDEN